MKLVEAKIAHKIENTREALMYDAWTRNGTHYIGPYASYVCKKAVSYEEVQRTQE